MNVHDCLTEPSRYARQIEKLHQNHLVTGQLYELRQSDVSLASFVLNRAKVARLIAKTVGRGQYRLSPAKIRTITTGDKERVVFAYPLADLVVHGAVASVIEDAIAPLLSDRLYSYRKGASWWTGVSAFAAFVRTHRRDHPEVQRRGLYVLRRDIDSYTDSIPVGGNSPLWEMLRRVLRGGDGTAAVNAADWGLIESVVRPEAFVKAGRLFTQYRGVATGQPISCVLFNLYLSGLDAALARIPGAFYARYCDDLVFAHPDPDVVRTADGQMCALLANLSLAFNESKSRDVYLTAAGRPSSEWPAARGTTVVPVLGCHISARGEVSLGPAKRRRLLVDLQSRALRTARALQAASLDDVGRTVCAAINRSLAPKLEFTQERSAALVRRVVTDRHDLKQLDYCIARIVLRAVTGARGPQAFRYVSYRKMREDWRLISLFHARNQWARRRETGVAVP